MAKPQIMNKRFSSQIFTNTFILFFLLCVGCSRSLDSSTNSDPHYANLHSLTATLIDGKPVSLDIFKGKVVLIANISLHCGTTPQLLSLETLYQTYKNAGLVVLGFPSNDFTGESKDSQEIEHICQTKYGVTFPLFESDAILGKNKQVVFEYLTTSGPKNTRGEVMFNMEKFLIDRNGNIRERFGPFTNAMSVTLTNEVESLLNEKN
jgi:glutathione peroxidase